MKNKKAIAMASALVVGSLLTLNGSVFADTAADANSSTAQPARLARAAQGLKMNNARGMHNNLNKVQQGNFQAANWDTKLKELVTNGTITQETYDKIQTYLAEQQAQIKAEAEKLQAMTAEQRREYFENKKSELSVRTDLFTTLVEKGVLTQTQADAIHEKVQTKQHGDRKETASAALDKLITAGTITQEQATKILDYMKQNQESRAAEMEKIKAMSAEERAAYIKSAAAAKTNILSQLVTDKVLTQEQADAAAKVIQPGSFGRNMHFQNKK